MNPILEKLKALPPDTPLTACHVAAIIQSLTAAEPDYEALPGSKMLDEQALADWLGESPSTIQKWRVKGGGPKFVKLPKAVRYQVKAVRDWIEGKTVSSTTEATVKGISRLEAAFPVMRYADGHETPFFQSFEEEAEPVSYRMVTVAMFPTTEQATALNCLSRRQPAPPEVVQSTDIAAWFAVNCLLGGFCDSAINFRNVFSGFVESGGNLNATSRFSLAILLVDKTKDESPPLLRMLQDCPAKHTELLLEALHLGLDVDKPTWDGKTARTLASLDSTFIKTLAKYELSGRLESLLPMKNDEPRKKRDFKA